MVVKLTTINGNTDNITTYSGEIHTISGNISNIITTSGEFHHS